MRRRRPLFRALTHTGNLPADVRYRTDAFDYCRLCIDPMLPILFHRWQIACSNLRIWTNHGGLPLADDLAY